MDMKWWEMPEDTKAEIRDKILAIVYDIRSDWNDPRYRCRSVVPLMDKLSDMDEGEPHDT